MSELCLRNRQRDRAVNLRWLRRITNSLLQDRWADLDFELGIYLVPAQEMARLNETFLRHTGSTDVVTFDYSEAAFSDARSGEIFICVADAVKQARQFRTGWPAEVIRYLVHGLLHLEGFDDVKLPDRRIMKKEENRVLKNLARRFRFNDIARHH